MTRRTRQYDSPAACLVVLLAFVHMASAQPPASAPAGAAPIPESEIASLAAELAQPVAGKSATEMRMACKSLVRRGKAILKAHPGAPNRYRVLAIVFQSQKRLLGLESSERNRGELFDTCKELAQAPNEYAGLRLEADLLLSDRDLTARDATLAQRAEALAAIVERYRGTPAEAKSLMMAALIAPKLEAPDLEDEIFQALNERFADDPLVIEFIQKNLGISRMDVLLAGTFTRIDGTVLRFPADLLGHLSIMVFWSRETPGIEQYLKQIKDQQALYAGRFEVFSFNVDELPDGGKAILSQWGLDWTVMRLPGGRKSQTYQTYVQKDPLGILVNAYGRAVLAPTVVRKTAITIEEARVSDERYLAQLQSLFIGDFLVTDTEGPLDPSLPPELKMISMKADAQAPAGLKRTAESVPAEMLRAIQACFAPPPFRYRLTTAEALANYTKAEKLCRDAIEKHPKAPDLWLVRNRRIISLMGMWNLAGEPKYLQQAAEESRASLAGDLPPAAGVAARFCLAAQSLRQGEAKAESVLSALVQESGGEGAPASAVAAAAVLAIEAGAKDMHERYRGRFMEAPYEGNPALWSLVSFLRDRYHRYCLFKGNYTRPEDRAVRSYIVNHGSAPSTDRMPAIELKTLDGKTLSIPKDTNGQLTLLVFVEPPEVIKTEPELDAKGRPKKKAPIFIMERAQNLADRHIHQELNVIAAFLYDDPNKVQAMVKAEEWKRQVAMVPGGLANPMVQRLGILSADRIPNVFLLRRDGTIQWQASGFLYKADYGSEFSMYLAMKVHTEVCEVQTGYEALRQGDFERAASVFSGPFLPEEDERYQWAGPRFHGLALAHTGLKQWDKALADIDAAVVEHQKAFDDAKNGPCDIMAEMRLVRATILDQLGRKEEAEAERKLAAAPNTPHRSTPYGVFQAKLTALRHDHR